MFGDSRFRGRVERILRASSAGPIDRLAASERLEEIDVSGLGTIGAIKVLFERRLAWLLADETPVSMNELRNLMEVQQRLFGNDRGERLRRLHRQRRGYGQAAE